ncbi:MAG: AAA family ATPase [bacterium]
MKIAVYGISRVGKDSFITQVCSQSKRNIKHLKGSSYLQDIAKTIYNESFDALTTTEQKHVREMFAVQAKELETIHDDIIVDGHYSFPNKHGTFDIVMTQEDIDLYDIFMYLDKDAKTVYSQSAKNPKKHSLYLSDIENIKTWKAFDKSGLKKVVTKNQKKWLVINEFYKYQKTFIDRLLSNFEYYNVSGIVNRIIESLINHNHLNRDIILLDCDKTLSINDLTIDVFEHSDINPSILKTIFKGNDYTEYQFFNLQNCITSSKEYNQAISLAIDNVQYNERLLNELKQKNKSTFIALTTGLADAWHDINEKYNLFDFLIGKGTSNEYYNYFVTPEFKGLFAEALKAKGYHVTAIGDSIIDIPMLEAANKGVLVAMQKLDTRIINYLSDGLSSQIKQFSFNTYKYNDIKEIDKL